MTATASPAVQDSYLRLPDVKAVTGLGRSTIYRRIKASAFPEPYDLGGGAVGWRRSQIDQWIAERPRRQLSG